MHFLATAYCKSTSNLIVPYVLMKRIYTYTYSCLSLHLGPAMIDELRSNLGWKMLLNKAVLPVDWLPWP